MQEPLRLTLSWLLVLACACSDDARSAPDAGGAGSAGSAGSSGDAGDDVPDSSTGAPDGAVVEEDPCAIAALRAPNADGIYYLAVDEPGADNDACDGLSPTDEGGGHCPFKDFDSERTRALLVGASQRVELRAGTYVIHGWDGLRVEGTGESASERLVLSAYEGEEAILDVPAPDGAGCTEMTAMEDPDCVRQVLRIAGAHTTVQGLTIRNGLAYHAEINGGTDHVFQCNTVGETVAFSMRSDLVKIDGHVTDVKVLHNDLSHFRSQAIDMTQVDGVLIEGNDFHDPIDDDAGATGSKFGARNVTIRGNRIHDLGSDRMSHVFSLGGTGSEHPDMSTAFGIHVEGNRVWNVPGLLAQIVSCVECSITDNVVVNAGAGVLISAAALGTPECMLSTSGCVESSTARISGNRMRMLVGGEDEGSANTFIWVESGEGGGLQMMNNVYCASDVGSAHFGWQDTPATAEEFQDRSGTDSTSRVLAASDPDCAFEP